MTIGLFDGFAPYFSRRGKTLGLKGVRDGRLLSITLVFLSLFLLLAEAFACSIGEVCEIVLEGLQLLDGDAVGACGYSKK